MGELWSFEFVRQASLPMSACRPWRANSNDLNPSLQFTGKFAFNIAHCVLQYLSENFKTFS